MAAVAFGVVSSFDILADGHRSVTRVGANMVHSGDDNNTIHPSAKTVGASDCHPSYSGRCVPANALDVDCAGGGGNGPKFVSGPLRVIGPDVYRLDGDGDGRACEPQPR